MEKKSIKALKIVSVLTLIFIIVGIMLYAFQTYFVFSRNGIDLNSPRGGFKLAWFIASRVFIFITAGLLIAFVKNIIKSIKRGEIFNRCNVRILFALAVVLPINAFLSDNLSTVCLAADRGTIILTDTPFVYIAVTLLVAILYKLACDAAEEQKLAV